MTRLTALGMLLTAGTLAIAATSRAPVQDPRTVTKREAFIQRFGREPGLTEPVFFDPNADDPQPLDADEVTAALLNACEEAGLNPDEVFSHVGWGADLDEYRKKVQ